MTRSAWLRAAIAAHSTATSDGAWDGPANEARCPNTAAALRASHAWIDPEGDPTAKSSYRFIHHEVGSDGAVGAANMKACSSGIGVLNGGRGGTTIPDADRAGVHRHLAKHMMDAGMEPPDLASRSSGPDLERRVRVGQVELREAADGQPSPMLVGYAAVFNVLSEDLGGLREIIEPGAFTKTLREADVRALVNHDPNYVLGRTKSGTLRLSEDATGLRFEVDVPDTTWARDLVATMRRGDVNQCSFSFRSIRNAWETDEASGMLIWRQKEVALYDVSPAVTFPAYPQTSSAVRAHLRAMGMMPEMGDMAGMEEDPDLVMIEGLIHHHAEMVDLITSVRGDLHRPEAVTMADSTMAELTQHISEMYAMLSAWSASEMESNPSGGNQQMSAPGRGVHLLDLVERELELAEHRFRIL